MTSGLSISKKVMFLLALANIILLGAGWIMALYAYPRLPLRIPVWINFLGQQTLFMNKSILYFIYPFSQSLFCLIFWYLQRIMIKKNRRAGQESLNSRLKREFIFLTLIFFNLLFIHLQRSIILTAHRIEEGVSEYYFFSLFGIILILIPYYRIRSRMIMKKGKIPKNSKKF